MYIRELMCWCISRQTLPPLLCLARSLCPLLSQSSFLLFIFLFIYLHIYSFVCLYTCIYPLFIYMFFKPIMQKSTEPSGEEKVHKGELLTWRHLSGSNVTQISLQYQKGGKEDMCEIVPRNELRRESPSRRSSHNATPSFSRSLQPQSSASGGY